MSSYPLYPLSANHVHRLSAETQSFAPEITFEKTPRFLGKVYDKVGTVVKRIKLYNELIANAI